MTSTSGVGRSFGQTSYIYFFFLSEEREEKKNKYIDKKGKSHEQLGNGSRKTQRV